MDDTVNFEEIGLATSGAVGSDLANMINEAAIAAVKAGRKYVSQKDLFEAVEVVIAGKEKKDRVLSKEEKQTVAYHEVGHALVHSFKERLRASTEDYYCTKNYGFIRLCNAGSRRRKVLTEQR